MKNTRVVIFWTDENTHPWILSELREGRLRQGWGAHGMQLTEGGKPLSFSRWAESFSATAQKIWGGTPSLDYCKTRHSILSRMLLLQRGDLVVVPRMPRQEEFATVRITEGYTFDDSQFDRIQDFGHVLRVDKESLKSFRHDSSPKATATAAKFRHYRSAVNNVSDDGYAEKIRTLYGLTA